jgi:hypothetical protein
MPYARATSRIGESSKEEQAPVSLRVSERERSQTQTHRLESHSISQSYGWSSSLKCAVRKNAILVSASLSRLQWYSGGGREGRPTINEMIPRRAADPACGLDRPPDDDELHAVHDGPPAHERLDQRAERVHCMACVSCLGVCVGMSSGCVE